MKRLGLMVLINLGFVGMVWAVNPAIATSPPVVTPPVGPPSTTTGQGGGYYDTETQVFHEDLAVVGVPFVLHYSSRRVPGYGPGQSICVNAIGDGATMKSVSIALIPETIAVPTDETALPTGLTMVETVADIRSLSYVIRAKEGVMWPKPVTVVIRYYWEIFIDSQPVPGGSVVLLPIPMNRTVYQQVVSIGTAGTQSSGLGGWSPGIQHAYCPSNQTLYTGGGLMIKMDVGVATEIKLV